MWGGAQIILSLHTLLTDPNPSNPLRPEVAKLLSDDPEAFYAQVDQSSPCSHNVNAAWLLGLLWCWDAPLTSCWVLQVRQWVQDFAKAPAS